MVVMVQLAIPGVGVLGGCPGLHLWSRGGVGRGKRDHPCAVWRSIVDGRADETYTIAIDINKVGARSRSPQ